MSDYELGVIGVGNMGEAILRGAIRQGFIAGGAVAAFDPAGQRAQALAGEFGLSCAETNLLPGACPRVLLAVKPYMIQAVLEEIRPVVRDNAVIISIAAGITTKVIDEQLGGKGHVVRAMPNTPMLVGCGATAVAAGPRATSEDLDWARRLFAASGLAIVLEERLMDAVTGLSGSGPAYLFYLVEAMTAAGVAEGIAPDVAALLATQTCIGAGKLLAETKKSAEQLRAAVTTPNGTTERAITTMESAGVKAKIIEAIRAAAARSRELGK